MLVDAGAIDIGDVVWSADPIAQGEMSVGGTVVDGTDKGVRVVDFYRSGGKRRWRIRHLRYDQLGEHHPMSETAPAQTARIICECLGDNGGSWDDQELELLGLAARLINPRR